MKRNRLLTLALIIAFILPAIAGCDRAGERDGATDGGYPDDSDRSHYVSFNTPGELRDYLAWSPERKPLIGAHRGGPLPSFPENCLATFENSLTYAPCLIECDVRISRDSVLLMMHDGLLDRTTTGKGEVQSFSWEELQKLKLLDNDGKITSYLIPSLGDALEWARGKAILELDIKNPVTPEAIIAMIAKHEAESFTVVITYNTPSALQYHELNPELVISASARDLEGAQRLIESGISTENIIAFVGVSEPDRPLYDYLHSRGIRTILGTMGNLDRRAEARGHGIYVELLQRGADILATDNVPLAAMATEEFVQ